MEFYNINPWWLGIILGFSVIIYFELIKFIKLILGHIYKIFNYETNKGYIVEEQVIEIMKKLK